MIIFESFNKYCHLFFNFFKQFLQSKNIRINFICTSYYMFQISMSVWNTAVTQCHLIDSPYIVPFYDKQGLLGRVLL